EQLLEEGKIRYIGVSNFSVDQFKEAEGLLKNSEIVANQLRANIKTQKHIHYSLPYYRKEGVILTAYSPLGHRGYTNLSGELRSKLEEIAKSHEATIQQISLAWLINHENVIAIPKAFRVKHTEENAAAAEIKLSEEEIKQISNK
ncbi:hypothetical protein LCGC14_2551200, partial [marine sediment metagenome]